MTPLPPLSYPYNVARSLLLYSHFSRIIMALEILKGYQSNTEGTITTPAKHGSRSSRRRPLAREAGSR